MTTNTHQELLKKYAEAIVKVGLNLRKGQRLVITNATARGVPPAGRALVHEVTKAAYAAGAKYVEAIWGDEEMHRIRLQNAARPCALRHELSPLPLGAAQFGRGTERHVFTVL